MPQSYQNVGYSLGQGPLSLLAPLPVVSKSRAPTTADKNFPLGQMWVYTASNIAYILTSIANNSATWTSINSSVAGSLASLTITGAAPNLVINSMTSAGVLVNSAAGSVTSQALTNGQVLIGSTGAAPVAATLTAGSGISIATGAGTITISETGSGVSWSLKGANFNAAVGNGYVITETAGTVTATLPAAAALGDIVEVLYRSATAADIMIISVGAGTSIRVPGNTSTTGVTLTFPACNLAGGAHPSVYLTCVNSTGPVWQVAYVSGNPTLS